MYAFAPPKIKVAREEEGAEICPAGIFAGQYRHHRRLKPSLDRSGRGGYENAMRRRLFTLLALSIAMAGCSGFLSAQETAPVPAQSDLTIERLFASPSLDGPATTGVRYAPDGKRVTYLKAREEDSGRYDLWQLVLETGERSMLVDSTLLEPEDTYLPEDEKAMRERKRIAGRRGIVEYDWAGPASLLVPAGGDLYLVEVSAASAYRPDAASGPEAPSFTRLTRTDEYEYDARTSPRGRYVSFVREGAVFAHDLGSREEIQITPDADPENAITYGVAEFVAQEEMDRYTGYWWSPDERYLVYTRVDESMVDIVERFDIHTGRATVISQRYPRAGRPNAVVDLFVRDMKTGKVTQIDWRMDDFGAASDQYLARVNWAGDTLTYQFLGRDQSVKRWRAVTPGAWNAPVNLPVEHNGRWVNLSNDFLPVGDLILFTSEDSGGFRHIRTVTKDGTDGDVIAGGEWAVSAIAGIDQENNLVFFTGFIDTPLEQHLYVRPIERNWIDLCPECRNLRRGPGVPPVRMTGTGKSWSIAMAPDGKTFVATSSSPDQPPQTGLYRIVNAAALTGTPSAILVDVDPGAVTEDMPLDEIAAQVRSGFYGIDAVKESEGDSQYTIRFAAVSPEAMSIFQASMQDIELYSEARGRFRLNDIATVRAASGHASFRIGGEHVELVAWIEENALDETHPYFPYLDQHTIPEYGTLAAGDGQTLHYSIQTPPDFDPSKKYPVIIDVYGGPHVQTVQRDWQSLEDQYLTRQGYIVFRLDNRGSYNRGHRFEAPIHRRLGSVEVEDQLKGVEWLKGQPFVEAGRIAIQGWSYGGYMALMTSLQAPEGTFAAVVSGAPVTDWALYDTFYAERYMGLPEDNRDGYEQASVFHHLEQYRGALPPLLLLHGMADDNVTFDNTTRLMTALQERAIPFDLMTYPGQRHGIRAEALKTHLMKTRMAFLDRHLKPVQAQSPD